MQKSDFTDQVDAMEEKHGVKIDDGIRKIVEIIYDQHIEGDDTVRLNTFKTLRLNDPEQFATFVQTVAARVTMDAPAAKLMLAVANVDDEAMACIIGLGIIDGIAIGADLARMIDAE